jgi:hypothetical protein
MNAGAMFLRDVGWDPDFLTVGEVAAELHRRNQGGEVNGVFAVTQWGLIRLVEALGGVEAGGEFILPSQTLSVIEQRTDSDGTGYLQEIFTGLLDSVRGNSPAGTQLELLRALSETVSRKDLMLFSVDTDQQELIERLHWGGRFPVDGRDRLAIFDSNIGWSKSDRSIERSAIYTVDLTLPDLPRATLTAGYRHTGLEIGRGCELQDIPEGQFALYEVSRHSCYWDYFRSYVAVGAKLVTGPELPLPANSVVDRVGRQDAGTPTFGQGFDEYGDHFTGLFALPPGGNRRFTIEYLLPGSVVTSRESAGLAYELVLVAQPGARGRDVTVQIVLPAGQMLESSSHEPASRGEEAIIFEIDLQQDLVLRIETTASG